jgi:hypothetical protein
VVFRAVENAAAMAVRGTPLLTAWLKADRPVKSGARCRTSRYRRSRSRQSCCRSASENTPVS